MRFRTLIVAFASVLSFTSVQAQPSPQEKPSIPSLRFATTEGAPFVYKTATGDWTGFDIELAQAIGEELKQPVAFENYVSFPDLLKAVQDRKTDAAISSISITSERSKKMDFSTPYYNSGLMIMTREQNDGSFGGRLYDFFWKDLPFYASTLAPTLLVYVLFIALCTIAIVQANKMKISDAFYSVLTTTRSDPQGKAPNRVWHVMFVLVSTVFCGIFIAQLTSAITTRNFIYEISLPKDLRGKDVATVDGTTSVALLREKGAKAHLVTDINDAYKMLEAGQVDAIVYDAPTLQFYSKNDGAGKVVAVGSVFAQQGYGIALPEGSELRTLINQAILKIKENGVYDRINERYFGIE